MEQDQVEIRTPAIRLDGLLKYAAAVATGGEAKARIQDGQVRVNGVPETRRRRMVVAGDQIELLDDDGEVALRLEVISPSATGDAS